MKKSKILTAIIITLISFFLIKNFCFNEKYEFKNCNSQNIEEVLDYNLYTSFEKNNKKTKRLSLITDNEGLFDYDINFELEGNSKKFKVIALLNYVPVSFSLDNDEFSMKKDIYINSSKKYNFKFKNKIEGFNTCNFIFIPYNIQSKRQEINNIHYLSGFINNNIENRNKLKKQNIITMNNQCIPKENTQFSFLINSQIKNNKIFNKNDMIKCKPGQKLNIPIMCNLHDKPDCNYNLFLNDEMIELDNHKFSKSIKINNGNIFCDNLIIKSPNKKGEYILWGLIHYDLYGKNPNTSINSNNSIILKVE